MASLPYYSIREVAELEPRVRAGEETAIQRMILLFMRPAFKFKGDAMSVAVTELIRAVRGLVGKPPSGDATDLTKYLLTCLKRRARRHSDSMFSIRTSRVFTRLPFRMVPNRHEPGIPVPAVPEEDEDWTVVRNILDGLGDRERQVVDLRLEGLSDVDIAIAMGVSRERIRQLRERIITHVRRGFEERGMGDLVRAIEKQPARPRNVPHNVRRNANSVGDSAGRRAGAHDNRPVLPAQQGGLPTGLVLPFVNRLLSPVRLESNPDQPGQGLGDSEERTQ